jgi:hypothetical protein
MLVKLIPEQISRHWDIIKYGIEESLPPVVGSHPDRMNRILSSALCGTLDVWVSYLRMSETVRLEAVVVTKILYDDSSNTKNLLIYCLYGYEAIDNNSWTDGFKTLLKYAKAIGCSRIVAYTEYGYIVKLFKELGGEAKYTFLSYDTNKLI